MVPLIFQLLTFLNRILRAAQRANLTGFDPKALAAASGKNAGDPWARR